MITKNLRKYGFAALVILIFLLIYVAQSLIVERSPNFNSKSQSLQCNFINLECRFSINGNTAIVRFDKSPQAEEVVTLSVVVPEGVDINSAWVEGVNMYMGKVPVLLESKTRGTWEGWFMLGSCSEPTMHWRLLLNIEGQETPASLFFTTSLATSATADS